jgi:hypothetical protein
LVHSVGREALEPDSLGGGSGDEARFIDVCWKQHEDMKAGCDALHGGCGQQLGEGGGEDGPAASIVASHALEVSAQVPGVD